MTITQDVLSLVFNAQSILNVGFFSVEALGHGHCARVRLVLLCTLQSTSLQSCGLSSLTLCLASLYKQLLLLSSPTP